MAEKKSNILLIIKLVAVSYALTAILILLFTFIVYKTLMNDDKIVVGILVIYTLSNLIAGFIAGKVKKQKKFVWGLIAGATYFIILILLSFIATREFIGNQSMLIPALLATVGGGMIGGMLS